MALTGASPETKELWGDLIIPQLFAILVGTLLSGVVFSQLISYYLTTSKAPRLLERVAVFVAAISSVVLVAFDWWAMYNLTVVHGADPRYVMTFHTADYLRLLSGAVGMAGAQAWFLDRAARCVRMYRPFVAFSGLVWLAELGAAVALSTLGWLSIGTRNHYETRSNLAIAWFWLGAAVDVLATSVLCWKARQVISEARRRGPNPLLDLVRLSFATGLLTALVALAGGSINLVTRQRSNAFIAFVDNLPRLCVLSMLITINSTREWQRNSRPNTLTTAPSEHFVVGFPLGVAPATASSGSAGVYSPTFDTKEYEIDCTAFDRTLMASPSSRRRSSAATHTGSVTGSHRWGLSEVPELPTAVPRPSGWAHVSEIGSEGDLERALRFYNKPEGQGLSPNLEAYDEPPASPKKRLTSFSIPALAGGHRSSRPCGSGIVVGRVVTTAVEE